MCRTKYRKKNRLDEVIALIQVLAFDPDPHRSEDGLQQELQSKPISAENWTTICKEHPEFFRVKDDEKHPISLITRHVLPRGTRDIDDDLVKKLIEIAVNLHDKQHDRANKHWLLVPIYVALIVAATSIFLAFYKPKEQSKTYIISKNKGDTIQVDLKELQLK